MKRKFVWAAFANLHGLWSCKPLKCTWMEDCNSWWWNQEYDVKKLGLDHQGDYCCFASYNRKDVLTFIKGFRAATALLKDFTSR